MCAMIWRRYFITSLHNQWSKPGALLSHLAAEECTHPMRSPPLIGGLKRVQRYRVGVQARELQLSPARKVDRSAYTVGHMERRCTQTLPWEYVIWLAIPENTRVTGRYWKHHPFCPLKLQAILSSHAMQCLTRLAVSKACTINEWE